MRARRHQTPEIVLCRKMSVSRIALAAVIISCFSCSLTAPTTRQKNELKTTDLVISILRVNEGRNKAYPSLSDAEIQNFVKFLKRLSWFESMGQYSNIGISVNQKRNTPVTRSEMKEDVTKGLGRENNARGKVANRMPWNRSAVFSNILKRFGGFDSMNHYSAFGTFQKRNTSLVSHEMKEDASRYRGMEYSARDRIVKRIAWYRLKGISRILNLFGGFHSVNHYSKFGKFQKRNTSLAGDEVKDDVTKDARTLDKDLGMESNVRDSVPKRFSWFRWSFPIVINGKFYKSLS